jgi:hypothetical protein
LTQAEVSIVALAGRRTHCSHFGRGRGQRALRSAVIVAVITVAPITATVAPAGKRRRHATAYQQEMLASVCCLLGVAGFALWLPAADRRKAAASSTERLASLRSGRGQVRTRRCPRRSGVVPRPTEHCASQYRADVPLYMVKDMWS